MNNQTDADDFEWGPVADDNTIRIEFPLSDKQRGAGRQPDWVAVKRYITEEDDSLASDAAMVDGMKVLNRADRRKVARGQPTSTGSDTQMFFRAGTYRLMILKRLVKDWSFVDASGRKIPVTPDTIVKLPQRTRNFIMERVDELNPTELDVEIEDDEEGMDVAGLTEEERAMSPLDAPTNGFSSQ